MTTQEVATRLRVHPGTVKRWRERRRRLRQEIGPAFVQIEGSIRYPRDVVEAYARGETGGGA